MLPCHLAKHNTGIKKDVLVGILYIFEDSSTKIQKKESKNKFMKRTGNLYNKIYSIDNLRLAHLNAKRGKGWYKGWLQHGNCKNLSSKYIWSLSDVLYKFYKSNIRKG